MSSRLLTSRRKGMKSRFFPTYSGEDKLSFKKSRNFPGMVAHFIIPSAQETEIRRIAEGGQLGQKVPKTPSQPITLGVVVHTCNPS
jgi:hypothetical protein